MVFYSQNYAPPQPKLMSPSPTHVGSKDPPHPDRRAASPSTGVVWVQSTLEAALVQVAELRDEGCLGLVASTKGLGLRFREDMVARAYERLHGRPPGPTLRFFEVQLPHRFADPAEVQQLVSAMSWEAHVVRSYQGWGDGARTGAGCWPRRRNPLSLFSSLQVTPRRPQC